MPEYPQHTGGIRKIVLQPEILRAYWSRRRAWQDEQVKLYVETRYIKDGTPLKLHIWEAAADGTQPAHLVTEVKGSHRVTNNRCQATYRIKWDPASIGRELRLKREEWEFRFVATIEKPALKKVSGLLYVDLHRLVPSL